jgi:hypothetical protein
MTILCVLWLISGILSENMVLTEMMAVFLGIKISGCLRKDHDCNGWSSRLQWLEL